jgi:hypothetical protein
VRVGSAAAKWVVGPVGAITPTSIWIDESEFQLGMINRLEVSTGTHSRLGRGLALGLLAGAGAGLAFAVALPEDGPSSSSGAVAVFFGVPIGAIVGGVTGALLGARSKHDRWERVDTGRLRVAFLPQRGAPLGLGLSASF